MTDNNFTPIPTRAKGGPLLPGLSRPSRLSSARSRDDLYNTRRNLVNEMANNNANLYI